MLFTKQSKWVPNLPRIDLHRKQEQFNLNNAAFETELKYPKRQMMHTHNASSSWRWDDIPPLKLKKILPRWHQCQGGSSCPCKEQSFMHRFTTWALNILKHKQSSIHPSHLALQSIDQKGYYSVRLKRYIHNIGECYELQRKRSCLRVA